MEYLEGRDLGAALAMNGPMEPERSVQLIRGCLAGLARGHRLEVVHKAIKPANLFLVPDQGAGQPEMLKVLDFGIARTNSANTGLTSTGSSASTPQYAAPEYVTAGRVSPAIDVYQVGLVWVEMLLGRRLVEAESGLACLQMHKHGLELPGVLADSPFGEILSRAIARNPEDRFRDAGAFLEAVDRLSLEAVRAFSISPEQRTVLEQDASTFTLDTASFRESTNETVYIDSPAGVSVERSDAGENGSSGRVEWSKHFSPLAVAGGLLAALLLLSPIIVSDENALSVTNAPKAVPASSDEGGSVPQSAAPDFAVSPPSASAPSIMSASSERLPSQGKCGENETKEGALCVPNNMVFVSSGIYIVGCVGDDPDCGPDEAPSRELDLEGFFVDAFEVSVEAYRDCVDAGVCSVPARPEGKHATWDGSESSALPVNGVDWTQARAYCDWKGKRLPTEMEWEAAARGHVARRYPWGDEFLGRSNKPLANVADVSGRDAFKWYQYVEGYDDGFAGPGPVGEVPQNELGIYGLGGNVREWTSSCYATSPSADGGGAVESDESCSQRVARGGYFGSFDAKNMRASARHPYAPDHRGYAIGFRCARSVGR